jgi:hypothetical protein
MMTFLSLMAPRAGVYYAAPPTESFGPKILREGNLAEDENLYNPTSSRYDLSSIVDLIATVARSRGPKVLECLRCIKQGLIMYKVNDPRLLLGDERKALP